MKGVAGTSVLAQFRLNLQFLPELGSTLFRPTPLSFAMSRYDSLDDDAFDDEDNEYDDDIDTDDESTIECPHCRREVHEDAPRCPYCEKYLSVEDSPPSRKPWWIYLGVAVCLLIVYGWIFGWW